MTAKGAAALEDRLTELEMRVSYLDDTLATLNDVVIAQGRKLDVLAEIIAALRGELGAVRGMLDHDPAAEPPPPHY